LLFLAGATAPILSNRDFALLISILFFCPFSFELSAFLLCCAISEGFCRPNPVRWVVLGLRDRRRWCHGCCWCFVRCRSHHRSLSAGVVSGLPLLEGGVIGLLLSVAKWFPVGWLFASGCGVVVGVGSVAERLFVVG
jgi:hypothetical protein